MPGKRYDRQFKLSAARLVLEGEIPVKGLSDQLNVPCCTLRRWAAEYEADGEDAFPGSGQPRRDKDHEILKLKKENEELRKEVAILKNPGLLEASPSVRLEFVRTGEHGMSVKKACGALGVSRGGYSAFLNRPKSSRQTAREALEPFVEDIFYANNRRYGSRRIVVELRKIGIVANGKTAQRMMARKGLVSCRGPKKHGRGRKASDKGANVLNGEFSVQKRNSVRRGAHHLHAQRGKDGSTWPPTSTCSLAR